MTDSETKAAGEASTTEMSQPGDQQGESPNWMGLPAVYIDRFGIAVGDGVVRLSMGEEAPDRVYGRMGILMSISNSVEFGNLVLKLISTGNPREASKDGDPEPERYKLLDAVPAVYANRFWINVADDLVQVAFADVGQFGTYPRLRIVMRKNNAWLIATTLAQVLPDINLEEP